MSLTTTEALNSAITDLISAKLCLLDATEVDCREELEQIRSVTHYLESKLEIAAAQEVSEMKRERGEDE